MATRLRTLSGGIALRVGSPSRTYSSRSLKDKTQKEWPNAKAKIQKSVEKLKDKTQKEWPNVKAKISKGVELWDRKLRSGEKAHGLVHRTAKQILFWGAVGGAVKVAFEEIGREEDTVDPSCRYERVRAGLLAYLENTDPETAKLVKAIISPSKTETADAIKKKKAELERRLADRALARTANQLQDGMDDREAYSMQRAFEEYRSREERKAHLKKMIATRKGQTIEEATRKGQTTEEATRKGQTTEQTTEEATRKGQTTEEATRKDQTTEEATRKGQTTEEAEPRK